MAMSAPELYTTAGILVLFAFRGTMMPKSKTAHDDDGPDTSLARVHVVPFERYEASMKDDVITAVTQPGITGRRHALEAAVVLVFIICSSTSSCHAFHSTSSSTKSSRINTCSNGGLVLPVPHAADGSFKQSSSAARTGSRLAQSLDATISTNTTTSDESESAVDWTRADTSTQIFPGGPGMLGLDSDIDADRTGAQEQSGYFTSAPYSRTLSYAKQKQKRTRELRRQMNKRRKRRRPRPATVAGRVVALFNKLRGRSNESTKMEDEDGYDLMYGTKQNKARHWLRHDGNAYYHNYEPRWKRLGKFVFRRNERPVEPGQLILVRHGESQWNANKTFTGWADPDLSPQGYREVEYAARLLLEGGYDIDMIFTSRLTRAIRSTWVLLQELNQVYLPVFKSWRLNERHYGALQGLCKAETAEQLGTELVQEWRGSLRTRPPAVMAGDEYWPGQERRYADLPTEDIPLTESLLDCMERTVPIWETKISQQLQRGRNVLVVAHANTLRGLVKIIDGIGDDEIQEVAIPTGIPIVYKFDSDMNPTSPPQGLRQEHMSGLFMEKPGLLKKALEREEEWSSDVPGYNVTMTRPKIPMSVKERALNKLNAERQLGAWAGQFIDQQEVEEDDGSDGNMGKGIAWRDESEVWSEGLQELEEAVQFDPDFPTFHPNGTAVVLEDGNDSEESKMVIEKVTPTIIKSADSPVCQTSNGPLVQKSKSQSSSTIVIIRHGKTEHNKLGLFTGWEDVPLAEEGVQEAKEAGRLLREYGFEFDVVYVSWLSRAIDTALYVLDEMGTLWLPVIKSWRLNERMYGSLTGLSKKMVAQKHGEEQFKAWRRGYKVRPPEVSSFSPNYPGNDERYTKYMDDVRYSVSESLIRSIEGNRIQLHRKLPKSESLYDCMSRTIPFYEEAIYPEAIAQGKRVLISSSENAIRGLLMRLCDIPEEEVTGLEIPNGVPLIFDLKSKCLKLLDDGSGQDPLERYNFGRAGKYLFQNCLIDEECGIDFEPDQVEITEQDAADLEFLKSRKA